MTRASPLSTMGAKSPAPVSPATSTSWPGSTGAPVLTMKMPAVESWMKTKFRGFIQYVTTARSLTGCPRLASPGGSSRTSLIVARGRRRVRSRDPASSVPSDVDVCPSTGRTIASLRATVSPVCTTKPSRSTWTPARVISSILTGILPVPSSIDEVPPGCWMIVPCTRTRCLDAAAGDARSRLSMDCTGTENGSDAAASSTWMSSGLETRTCRRTA